MVMEDGNKYSKGYKQVQNTKSIIFFKLLTNFIL